MYVINRFMLQIVAEWRLTCQYQEKGWLTHRTEGRSYVYSPLVPREESLGQRVLDMVNKACGGNPEKLMVALLQYRGLSDDETTRIRKILDDAQTKETQ